MSTLIPLALPTLNAHPLTAEQRMATELDLDTVMAVSREQIAFLTMAISRWENSPERESMLAGQRYFETKNDILERKRQVIGRDGEMIDAPYLANNKLPHAFMRKLTKQKVGYLLSKPFTVTTENEEFQKLLVAYFDANFYRMFKNGGQDAVIKGLGWIQVYYDGTGKLGFKRLPATEVIPFWRDIDHTILDGAIRVYNVRTFVGDEVQDVKHAQLFTQDLVFNYVMGDTGWEPDPAHAAEYNFDIIIPKKATVAAVGEQPVEDPERPKFDVEHVMWARVPLIPLKYNAEELSLLAFIKDLIDDYDRRTSDMSNVIQDEPDRVKVVKNYDGTDKGEFVYNLARYRTVFLRDNGAIDTLDTSISTDAIQSHLTRLRQDIYEFGGGVDTQNKDLGNASGVALRFVYSDLDMDCSDFASELQWALEQIVWFIKQDLILSKHVDYTAEQVTFTFNTDVAINETETITNLQNSAGILSMETLIEQHPYVTDAQAEIDRVRAAQEAEAQQLAKQMAASRTPTTGGATE